MHAHVLAVGTRQDANSFALIVDGIALPAALAHALRPVELNRSKCVLMLGILLKSAYCFHFWCILCAGIFVLGALRADLLEDVEHWNFLLWLDSSSWRYHARSISCANKSVTWFWHHAHALILWLLGTNSWLVVWWSRTLLLFGELQRCFTLPI